MDWINGTELDYEENLDDYLGFVYEVLLDDGRVYYGRKQFWSKRGKGWVESNWRTYQTSSSTIRELLADGDVRVERCTICAVFSSKSAIRYGEAAAIITSGSYLSKDYGINWSFEGCKGRLALTDTDREQLQRLEARARETRRYLGVIDENLRT